MKTGARPYLLALAVVIIIAAVILTFALSYPNIRALSIFDF